MTEHRASRKSSDYLIGQETTELTTPALLLDLDSFEANLQKMAEHTKTSGIGLRPHAKSHKCPEIALRQVNAGAVGVSAATIDEAEAMSREGVSGILITSEMVGRRKIERLVSLALGDSSVMSVVDNPVHAVDLNEAAQRAGVRLGVLIDLDLGLKRTGVAGVEAGMSLAEKICAMSNLDLRGISAYSSLSAHVVGFEERRPIHSSQWSRQ